MGAKFGSWKVPVPYLGKMQIQGLNNLRFYGANSFYCRKCATFKFWRMPVLKKMINMVQLEVCSVAPMLRPFLSKWVQIRTFHKDLVPAQWKVCCAQSFKVIGICVEMGATQGLLSGPAVAPISGILGQNLYKIWIIRSTQTLVQNKDFEK